MKQPSALAFGHFAVVAVLLASSVIWAVSVKGQVSLVPGDHGRAEAFSTDPDSSAFGSGPGISGEPDAATPLQVAAGADAASDPGRYLFTCKVSGGVQPYNYQWDTGDGATHPDATFFYYSYASPGTYHWRLQVADSGGNSSSASGTVLYTLPLSVAASGSPDWGATPLTVGFVAQVAGGTAPYKVEWDFGDDTPIASGTSVQHTYTQAWIYGWKMHVIDGGGMETIAQGTISVGFPAIANVKVTTKPSYALSVSGGGFNRTCSILINGNPVPRTVFSSSASLVGKGGKKLRGMLQSGVPVAVQVFDSSVGGASQPFAFTP